MRRFGVGVVTVLGVGAVLLLLLMGGTQVRHRKMLAAPPLSLEDVRRLTADNASSAVEPSATETHVAPEEGDLVLQRTLTDEERKEWFFPACIRVGWQYRATSHVWDEAATLGWLVGIDRTGKWYFNAGLGAELAGDQETARKYLRAALNFPLPEPMRKTTFAYLAWLENDPHVAQELLEAACAGESIDNLFRAVVLCDATGSEALRDHYLVRLQATVPGLATHVEEGLARKRAGTPENGECYSPL